MSSRHFFLADPSTNSVLGWAKASLAEAEAFGFEHPEAIETFSLGAAAKAVEAVKDGEALEPKASATKYIDQYMAPGGKVGRDALVAVTAAPAPEPYNPDEAGQLVEIMFAAPPKAGKYDLQLVVMSDCYVGCDRTIPIKLKVYPVTRATLEGREARSQSTKAAQQWDDSEDEDEAADKGSKEESEDEDEGDDYDSDESGELETGDEQSDNEDPKSAEDPKKK